MSAGGGGEQSGAAGMARRHAGPATRDELAPGMLMRALGVGVEDEGAAAGERADPAPSAACARLAVAAAIAGTALLAGVLGPGAGAGRYSAESGANVPAAAAVAGSVESQGDSFVKTKKFSSDVVLGAAAAAAVSMSALAGDAVQWRVADGGNGHWYEFISGTDVSGGPNFDAQDKACTSRGGHMATLESVQEWNFFLTAAPTVGGYWIGLRSERCANWTWATGEPLEFSAWGSSSCGAGPYPNNCASSNLRATAGNRFDCGWVWDDYPQGLMNFTDYCIEWSADCNSDGIVDYGQCHDGTLPDNNGNNIPDCCEQGVQCTVGNYPVQWKVSDGGNGHWYQALKSETPLTWSHALDRAASMGGHLATFESNGEFLAVVSPIVTNINLWVQETWWRGPWIGAYQDHTATDFAEPSGGWRWITGISVAPSFLSSFGYGNPNNYPCCEDYLQIGENPLEAGVNDVPEYATAVALIIEWDADCNNDGLVDLGQILNGTLPDTNTNNIPDCCEPGNSCCVGDIYVNHIVDGGDLGVLLSEWGVVTPTTRSDLNRDGFVDGADLGRLLANWGPCGG